MSTQEEDLSDDDELDELDEEDETVAEDPESLGGSIAALVDMYYLDEILVALAREIQTQAAEDHGSTGNALRADARALREAIGKLSGEA